MENLTTQEKVIRPHSGLDPLEVHDVVVYEQLEGSGEEFRGIVKPGGRFQTVKSAWRSWWNPRNYFAVAVNMSPELRLKFNELFTLDDQIHQCTVFFELNYRVSDSEKVASTRKDDPVRLLRDEIMRTSGRAVGKGDWEKIRHNFRNVEQAVIGEVIEDIRDYGAKLGFEVKAITLRCRLQEKDLEPALVAETEAAKRAKMEQEQKTEDFKRERERKLREEELKHKIDLIPNLEHIHSFEQRQKLREAITEGSSTAITNVGKEIRTPAELQEGINVTRQMSPPESFGNTQNHTEREYDPLLLGSGPTSSSSKEAEQKWARMLSHALTEVNGWSYSFEQRRSLSSAILHVVAELLLDDRADEERLKQYAEKIFTISRKLNPPPSAQQNRLLTKFTQYDQLREQFA